MNLLSVSSQKHSKTQLEGTLRTRISPSSSPCLPRHVEGSILLRGTMEEQLIHKRGRNPWIWNAEKWERSKLPSSFFGMKWRDKIEILKVLLGYYFYFLQWQSIRVRSSVSDLLRYPTNVCVKGSKISLGEGHTWGWLVHTTTEQLLTSFFKPAVFSPFFYQFF